MTTRSALAAGLAVLALAPSGAGASPVQVQEDASGWNWRTMGNHKRGIVTLAGRRLVVGPTRFDAINRGFRIDWTRTPRLHGDGHRFDVQDY